MAAESIIGRAREIKRLDRILRSSEAEFVALYGRRRVGKTFLIREFSATHTFMEVTGENGQTNELQVARFCHQVSQVFFGGLPLPPCTDWNAALTLLGNALKDRATKHPGKPIIVFLDELPWLAGHRSGLLQALDYAWNTQLSLISELRLIVCGSAAAWMLDKLIHAKGGLHNRITQRIELAPFSLAETSLFLQSRRVKLSQRQTALVYMSIGGVAHYLKQLQPGRSATQAIGELCFGSDGALRDEFETLFRSLFTNSDAHIAIVRALASKTSGLSQAQLVEQTGLSGGGRFGRYLRQLEASAFIASYGPFGKRKKDTIYRLVDPYSAFYLRWIEAAPRQALRGDGGKYWQSQATTAAYASWAGYAFETLCLGHMQEILEALGLASIGCHASTWRLAAKKTQRGSREEAKGAQIDLLLDRDDDTITICELKYSKNVFAIDRKYARELSEKLHVFESATKTKKTVQLVMICSAGLRNNQYSEDLVANSISLDALF